MAKRKTTFRSELIGELPERDRFERILQRERALADRGARSFSLMTFQVPFREANRGQVRKLIAAIDDVIRISDEMGWFRDEELGVVLIDTPIEGARIVGDRVVAKMSPDVSIDYTLYEYPTEATDLDVEVSSAPSGGVDSPSGATAEVRRLHLYLAPPIPLWKRVLDLVVASAMLLVSAPLLIFIAAMIKVASPGPVFFKQERIGYKMKPFTLWKFRTMHQNSDSDTHRKHFESLWQSNATMEKLDGRDARVIPGGNILRRSYLDELPQLINVVKGEMSLVGPRPPIRYEVEHYDQWQTRRFDTLPGLTGLWQVSGKNRTTFHEMMRLDIAYQRNRSLWRDIWITLKTVPAIVFEKVGFGLKKKKEAKSESLPEEELKPLTSAGLE